MTTKTLEPVAGRPLDLDSVGDGEPVAGRPLDLDSVDDDDFCFAHTSVTCGQNSGIPMCWETKFFPTEQGTDDDASSCWESHELVSAIDVLGQPCVSVRVSCDQSRGIIAVRVCDVFPDGTSMLITKGLLNLTHQRGHGPDVVSDLQPHQKYTIEMKLDATGYSLAAGHKLRVAVSPSYWPVVWPSARPATLTIYAGAISLPVYTGVNADHGRTSSPMKLELQDDKKIQECPMKVLRQPKHQSKLTTNEDKTECTRTIDSDDGCLLYEDTGTLFDEKTVEVYTLKQLDENTQEPAIRIQQELIMRKEALPVGELYRGRVQRSAEHKEALQDEISEDDFFAWNVRVTLDSNMTSDLQNFHLQHKLTCYHDNEEVFDRSWSKTIERDHV